MENIQEAPKLSEGEQIIEQFFLTSEITYIPNHKITNLRDDSRQYREADFYLPKFKMHVEFLGMWNVSETERQRYREKKRVYAINGLPCIYLYPENLGPLRQVFDYRMETELRAKKMRKELIRFKYYQLYDDFLKYLFYFFTISGFLFLWLTRNNKAKWAVDLRIIILWMLFCIAGLFFYHLMKFAFKFVKIFVGRLDKK